MTLRSHTTEEILAAHMRGETICVLDTCTRGQDDVLIGSLEDALVECDRHATYYDSMYEYVQGADISHYRCSTAEDDPDEIMIAEFSPADDSDFAIDPDHTIEVDTVRYVPVCWGEDGLSLLREDALEEVCFVRYMYNPLTHEYVSDGRAYETREHAEQSAD